MAQGKAITKRASTRSGMNPKAQPGGGAIDVVDALPAEPHSRIFKANDIVRARYSLPLQAHRVLSLYLAKVDRNRQDFPLMRIPMQEIVDTFPGLASTHTATAEIRKAVDELFNAEIRVERGNDWLAVRWVVTAVRNGPDILIRVNPDLRPYLLGLVSRYTSYELQNLQALRTPYQFRLYEFFRACSFQRGCRLMLDEARDMLAIPEGQYDNSAHFKARILTPSIEVINASTDLRVSLSKSIKEGKKVVGWDIEVRVVLQALKGPEKAVEAVVQRLCSHMISKEEADGLAEEFTVEYLEAKLTFVERMIEKGTVKHEAAFLRRAIREDWSPRGKQIEGGRVMNESAQTKLQETRRRYEYEQQVALLRAKAPMDIRLAKVSRAYEQQPQEVQAALQREYAAAANVTSLQQVLAESPLARARWQAWLCDRLQIPDTTSDEVTAYLADQVVADDLQVEGSD